MADTQDRGFVLIVVVGIMTTLVMLIVGFLSFTRSEAEMAVHVSDAARCENAAWSAVDWMVANISAQAFDSSTGQIDPDYIASRKDWWYREYKALQSATHATSDDWDFQSAIDGPWTKLNPWYESSWMYFPDADTIRENQMRVEVHLVDENAFVNVNDWLYDHAPTAAQMANMFVNQLPVSFLERDYMYVNGYVNRILAGGNPDQSDSLATPEDEREYARYCRTRLKPVEAFMIATAAQRAIKVLRAGHPSANPMQQAPSNRCYGHMEGGNVVWGGSHWGVLDMLRYFQDGHWNTAVHGSTRDNSSGSNLFNLRTRTERCGGQDPDTGCSPINLNTAARSGEGEIYASWASHSGGAGSAMNVIEAVVPVEALWQILIVDPSHEGAFEFVDWNGDGNPDDTNGDGALTDHDKVDDPNTGNGTASGAARIVITNKLLKAFMTDNPEIAGTWEDPDRDGNPVGGFMGADPEANHDIHDRRLYKEARQELVERMAWQLAFEYQETLCRWLMGCWWDLRGSGDRGYWRYWERTNGKDMHCRDYGDPGDWTYDPDPVTTPDPVPTKHSGTSGPSSGWDLSYPERYPWIASLAQLPGHYALKGNSENGDDLGVGREDSTRWPFGRSDFWSEISSGVAALSDYDGSKMRNPVYESTGAAQHLPGRVGVELHDDGYVVFEIMPGKIDRWTANAVYNSLRPGPSRRVWDKDQVGGGSDPLYAHFEDPLYLMSKNEDDGCFDTEYVKHWEKWWIGRDINDDGLHDAIDTGYRWGDTVGFEGWRADNSSGAAMGCRFPRNLKGGGALGYDAYLKFGSYAPDPGADPGPSFQLPRIYKNRYTYRWFVDRNGNGIEDHGGGLLDDDPDGWRTAFYPPRNMYLFNYDSAIPSEQEPPGMVPRSVKSGKDGVSRRQYWRKQFTPNSFATEVTNASTSFRFAVTAQLVDTNVPDELSDDRVYYERRIAGWFEIAPDLYCETQAGEMGTITANRDCGPWYSSGTPAYWRKNLNFEGWRRVSSHDGHGWDVNGADMQHKDAHRRHGDPRYREGEHPLGQHDRWYDFRGWHPSYYGGAAQTTKRVQFLHFIDNNLK